MFLFYLLSIANTYQNRFSGLSPNFHYLSILEELIISILYGAGVFAVLISLYWNEFAPNYPGRLLESRPAGNS